MWTIKTIQGDVHNVVTDGDGMVTEVRYGVRWVKAYGDRGDYWVQLKHVVEIRP